MRQIDMHSCLIVVLLAACAGSAEPSGRESAGVRGGALELHNACDDPGPEEPPTCLFGEVFSDIRTNEALLITSERWIRSADALTELEAQQLLSAVQQSSHSDVTTASEALERVDQQEVRRIDFYELASERWFVVYEYGVGDNSYGAFFDAEGTEVLASIHDGDLLSCIALPAPPQTDAAP